MSNRKYFNNTSNSLHAAMRSLLFQNAGPQLKPSLIGYLKLFSFFSLLILTLPIQVNAKTLDRVIAKINDSIVTLSEVEDRAKLITMERRGKKGITPFTPKEIKKEALNLILEEKLLVQEGKKTLNITVSDANVEDAIKEIKTANKVPDDIFLAMLEKEGLTLKGYKKKIREQIIISKVRNHHLRNSARISEKKLKQYYKKNRKIFLTPSKIHVRHILFIFGDSISETARELKREKAEEAIKKIRFGMSFKEAAKKYSEDVSASSGGDLGVLERGKMLKEFEEAAFKLKQGQVSPIVETPYGLHIIKVDKVIPKKYKTYKTVKPEIQNLLFGKIAQKQYARWIGQLKKDAFIENYLFDSPKKKTLSKKMSQTARLPRKSELNKRKKRTSTKQKTKMSSNGNLNSSDTESLKKRLQYIKILKKRNIITEQEYEKRKKNILKNL
jgi:parvulin-like peptidyl-prolyl isomerase